jgi:glycosyltransferase involved in cell wall biosynthesis
MIGDRAASRNPWRDGVEGSMSTEPQPDLSVLICTYNRADDLAALLETVCSQQMDQSSTFEIVVVDNNSTDRTSDLVHGLIRSGEVRLRYVFEPVQGKGYALTSGLGAASGDIIAIIDDDQLVPPGYLASLVDAFRANLDFAFIGGKVLPLWEQAPPSWLTPADWSPLGMADHGGEAFTVDQHRPVCLLTCAFRRTALEAVGGFRNDLGVTGAKGIGGVEDAEIQERLWQSGFRGLYLPHLVLSHRAPARRMTRAYFRRWHTGHGRFRARLTRNSGEKNGRRFLGIPAYMFRQAIRDGIEWVSCLARRDGDGAFRREQALRFFWGFLQTTLLERAHR